MLLSIAATHRPATDPAYLLHKHPDKFQSFDLSFGKAHVYYPEIDADRCTACLMLDVDAVGMVRRKNPDQNFLLAQYVNDRPDVASSFLSVAIAQVFGSALQGRCKDRPELVGTAIPLEARLDVLSVRGGETVLRAMFDPLAYEVEPASPPGSAMQCGSYQSARNMPTTGRRRRWEFLKEVDNLSALAVE